MGVSRSSGSPDPRPPAGALLGDLAAAVAACLDRQRGRRIAVGYSGGLDSTVLLHALAAASRRRSIDLLAVHVHHGLSPHADAWAAHCADNCARLDVPLEVFRVVVDDRLPGGVEAAARAARYAAFAGLAADALCLAHHRDDQAETLLFNLARGAGLAGASAMPAERPLARAGQAPLILLRPLLATPRRALLDYALAHRLVWIDDESNEDLSLARNALRRRVLPEIERLRPGAVANLARAAGRFAAMQRLLDDLARLDRGGDAVADDDGLSLDVLQALPEHRRLNMLRHWLGEAGVPIASAQRLAELATQVGAAGAHSRSSVVFGKRVVRVWRGRVRLGEALTAEVPAAQRVALDGAGVYPWAGGSVVLQETIGEGVAVAAGAVGELRPRGGGERLRLVAGGPSRSLKAWFQQRGVAPWQRQAVPLLWAGDRLLWAGGLGVEVGARAAPGERGLLPSWQPPPS